jgi:pimeloyl-ACP methyl ester carboxylesterase
VLLWRKHWTMSTQDRVPYDEFSMFHENAEEFGIPWTGPPVVRRVSTPLDDGRQLSSLLWGEGPPELVFLHGGAQNAHTWDTVALALDRPLLAIDLPGHGHSDGGRNGALDVQENAKDIATVVEALAPDALAVIGMSLGGVTALALTDAYPELVRALVLVDMTPGVTAEKSRAITAFVVGPDSFASFDDILARTIEHNPTRTVASLRRGILHNAEQRDDGSWVWRYARHRGGLERREGDHPDFSSMWDAVDRVKVPLLLTRGMREQSVVDDEDEAELLRRNPGAVVEHFEEAGHSLQGDTPVELAHSIDAFAPVPR